MNARILVVEDEPEILDNIKILLEFEGYSVITAANGLEGFEKAEKFLPDLILCDVAMPGLNGYEVLAKLSQKTETYSIPFIFLTAKTERHEMRKGMELGADDYISKPFTSDELLNAVKIRLKKYDIIKAKVLDDERNTTDGESRGKYEPEDTIFLNSLNETIPVKISSFVFISAQNQYTLISAGNKNFVIRKSLLYWENILPGKIFLKIHRSTIVNLNFIDRLEKTASDSVNVFMKDGKSVFEMSRRYYRKFKSVLPE